ncbi:MAG: site-specific integrase [Candidatus Dormibacter sp.]
MARRGAGEGSIFKRADGRWCAYLSLPQGGRRYLYGRTRADVQRKLATGHQTLAKGLSFAPERQTVGDFLTGWLEGQHQRLRPNTWKRYEEYVRIHTVPTLGRVKLAALSPQHLDRLYAQRIAAGLSPTTVHHIHAVLHKALEQAVRWNLVPRNVADLVDSPRSGQKSMRALSPEQTRTLLGGAADGPLEAILTLAVTTGMRKGELLGLRWSEVNLERGAVHVVGTMQRHPNGELVVSPPKTARSRRQVELTPVALDALRRHRARQVEMRLLLGPEWNAAGLVFPSSLGKPQDGSHLLYGLFHPLLERLGLPVIRFHDLRHTAATLLLGQGIHPKIVSEMLGHSTIAITLDLYSHVTPTMQRDAARAMNKLLAGS